MRAYYNEIDPQAAAWLRSLMERGLITDGVVDERSIADVRAEDLVGFDRVHFFAGIGGWELALQLAGWGNRPVWTGSCPCQPFSSAGNRKGTQDERHLWPEMYRLIRECKPAIVFGEQVASSAAVGSDCKNKGLQQMQDRKAVFGVLHELKRKSRAVQGMRESSRADAKAERFQEDFGQIQTMEERQSRSRACQCRKAQGEETRIGMQHNGGRHSEKDRLREVRAYWDRLLSVGTEIMERSVSGQDRLQEGVHQRQHASRLVCPQCHGEYMGGEEDFGDCVGDYSETNGSVEQFVAEACKQFEEDAAVWLDGVFADLEGEGYACGATVLGAHSVGAPHIRQRLWWVADADGGDAGTERQQLRRKQRLQSQDHGASHRLADAGCEHSNSRINGFVGTQQTKRCEPTDIAQRRGTVNRLADAEHAIGRSEHAFDREAPRRDRLGGSGGAGGLGHAEQQLGGGGVSGLAEPDRQRRQECVQCDGEQNGREQRASHGNDADGCGTVVGFGDSPSRGLAIGGHAAQSEPVRYDVRSSWSGSQAILCRDGKARSVKPGIAPLVDGLPRGMVPSCDISESYAEATAEARVMRLKGYGNAIVPQVAATFIRAYIDSRE